MTIIQSRTFFPEEFPVDPGNVGGGDGAVQHIRGLLEYQPEEESKDARAESCGVTFGSGRRKRC